MKLFPRLDFLHHGENNGIEPSSVIDNGAIDGNTIQKHATFLIHFDDGDGTTQTRTVWVEDNGWPCDDCSNTDDSLDGGAVGKWNSADFTVTIINVPPTVTQQNVVKGLKGTLSLETTDPSSADMAAGFNYKIEWGDGTIDEHPYEPAYIDFEHLYDNSGTYTAMATATDKDGGVSSPVSFTITIVDGTPPVLTVPSNITLEVKSPDFLINGENDPVVTGQATANDAIDTNPTISFTDTVSDDPDPQTLKVVTRTWFAQDASGNSVTADQLITFVDKTPPVVTDPADVTVEATAFDTPLADVPLGIATASDIFTIISIISDAPATFPLGDTLVHWTATDEHGNSATTSTQIVTVEDTTPPVLSNMPDSVTLEATSPAGAVHAFDLPTATDIADTSPDVECNPISGFTFGYTPPDPTTTTVTCTATDDSGNQSQAEFTVTVEDTTPPDVFVPDDIVFDVFGILSTKVPYSGQSSLDIVDGAITPTCTPFSGSVFDRGDTIVECSATDASGNSGSKSFTITVIVVPTPGKVTAGGAQLDKNTNFGFNIQSNDGDSFKGQLEYRDKTAGINIHSADMTLLSVSEDHLSAVVEGMAKDGSTFTILVEDNGEPGKNNFFLITIKDSNGQVIYEQEGNLSKGNIQIHKEKSKN